MTFRNFYLAKGSFKGRRVCRFLPCRVGSLRFDVDGRRSLLRRTRHNVTNFRYQNPLYFLIFKCYQNWPNHLKQNIKNKRWRLRVYQRGVRSTSGVPLSMGGEPDFCVSCNIFLYLSLADDLISIYSYWYAHQAYNERHHGSHLCQLHHQTVFSRMSKSRRGCPFTGRSSYLYDCYFESNVRIQ